ncbi:14265_t:CDS:2 [Acaulospora colombiana]|uniref:14265_t:CDS:1 n=1 Tax=Acaulospora colombiana TaxID=27376 RepID=A0ACA9K3K0_9GLOM|nr:14265_t:CDS:2 [Acaulospora colombiana]
MGLYLSNIPGWRLILLGAAALSLIQFVFLSFSVESPRFLASKPGGFHSAKRALQQLRGNADVDNELGGWRQIASEEELVRAEDGEYVSREVEDGDAITTDPIVDSPPVVFRAHTHSDDFDVLKFLTSPHYRPALRVIILVHLTQQLSGINAVLYYSTNILSKILPESSDLITVYISIVNTIMTLVSAYLMDKSGRRTLLLNSIVSMSAASTLLGLGIINDYGFLSAFSIILFVATFSFGLGPIPFLITPEIVDTYAVATASSFGMSLNWVANFLVGFAFLSVSKMVGGYVFFIFAIYLAGASILAKRFVPETKSKSVDEIWRALTQKGNKQQPQEVIPNSSKAKEDNQVAEPALNFMELKTICLQCGHVVTAGSVRKSLSGRAAVKTTVSGDFLELNMQLTIKILKRLNICVKTKSQLPTYCTQTLGSSQLIRRMSTVICDPIHVFIGVSGSGKSSIGNLVSHDLGIPLIEGDNIHNLSNIMKMEAGVPLDDSDREPWLQSIKEEIVKLVTSPSRMVPRVLVTCSALKLKYRDHLRRIPLDDAEMKNINVWFIYLRGSKEVLERRLSERKGHFMKVGMLDTQLKDLEEPKEGQEERIMIIDVDRDLNEVKNEVIDKIETQVVE